MFLDMVLAEKDRETVTETFSPFKSVVESFSSPKMMFAGTVIKTSGEMCVTACRFSVRKR